MLGGICNRLTTCAGCLEEVRDAETRVHACVCGVDGFDYGGFSHAPCGTICHAGCVRLGVPFTSRLPEVRGTPKGLSLPHFAVSPPFICEACTV